MLHKWLKEDVLPFCHPYAFINKRFVPVMSYNRFQPGMSNSHSLHSRCICRGAETGAGERDEAGEHRRQRQRDRQPHRDRETDLRETRTWGRHAINEFPGEKEGHGEITEQKEKTGMTFLKGLLCGICRKKNEMWGPGRDWRRAKGAWGEWNELGAIDKEKEVSER